MSSAVAEALERLRAEAVESNRLKREQNVRRQREEDEAAFQRARANVEFERAVPKAGLSFGAVARGLPFMAEVYGTKVPAGNVRVKDGRATVKCRCGRKVELPYDRATGCECGRSFVFDGEGVRVATARREEAEGRS